MIRAFQDDGRGGVFGRTKRVATAVSLRSLALLRLRVPRVDPNTIRSLVAMAGGSVAAAVLSAVGGVIQARLIDPRELGYFGSFAILAQYLAFMHLGSLTALQREYPYWIGKGEADRAGAVAAVALGWIRCVWVGLLTVYLFIAGGCALRGDLRAAAGWAAQGLMQLQFYVLYLGCLYRSKSDFVTWARVGVLSAATSVATLPLVALLGFWGMCIRGAVPVLVSAALLHRLRPVKVRPTVNPRALWALIRFGLPMDIAGSLGTSGTTATLGAAVVWNFGPEALGYVTVARVGEGVIQQLGLMVSQVFVPRVNTLMGQTESFETCAKYLVRPTILAVAIVTAAALAWSALCGPLIAFLLPRYTAATSPTRILAWAGLYTAMLLPHHALMAGKYTRDVAAMYLVSLVGFAALLHFRGTVEVGLTQVLWGYTGARLLTGIVCWGLVWRRVVLARQRPGGGVVCP